MVNWEHIWTNLWPLNDYWRSVSLPCGHHMTTFTNAACRILFERLSKRWCDLHSTLWTGGCIKQSPLATLWCDINVKLENENSEDLSIWTCINIALTFRRPMTFDNHPIPLIQPNQHIALKTTSYELPSSLIPHFNSLSYVTRLLPQLNSNCFFKFQNIFISLWACLSHIGTSFIPLIT